MPCRLLEVGALKYDNYVSQASWIDCMPIDLRSRHPLIHEQDFLKMDEEAHRAQWDGISLSLVLNFVPDPRDRGVWLHATFDPEGLTPKRLRKNVNPCIQLLTRWRIFIPCCAQLFIVAHLFSLDSAY